MENSAVRMHFLPNLLIAVDFFRTEETFSSITHWKFVFVFEVFHELFK